MFFFNLPAALLGEVDGVCERPCDILADSGRRAEPAGRPLRRPLVSQPRVEVDGGGVRTAVQQVAPLRRVEDAGALVGPQLGHLRQLVVPPATVKEESPLIYHSEAHVRHSCVPVCIQIVPPNQQGWDS